MVATPLLAGALLRIVMGVLVDHLQPKKAGIIGQIVVMIGLLWAWLGHLNSYGSLLVLGIILGMAGAAFAVALPLASRWYPPQHQGTALGIAGAGNSGTVFAALFAPSLAIAFGWQKRVWPVPDSVGHCLPGFTYTVRKMRHRHRPPKP
ncbi:MFS transporter [Undibacterium arcticum]